MEKTDYTFFQIYNAVDAIEDFFDRIQQESGTNCYEAESESDDMGQFQSVNQEHQLSEN